MLCGKRDRAAARRKKRLVIHSNPLVKFAVLETLADDLFSVWVRSTRGGCEMCKRPYRPWELQNAHGFSRAKKRVRYNEQNVFALCPGCHRKHTPPLPAWYVWFENRVGVEAYSRVEFLKDSGPRLYRGDVQMLASDYFGRILALPGEIGEWARGRAAEIVRRSGVLLTPITVVA